MIQVNLVYPGGEPKVYLTSQVTFVGSQGNVLRVKSGRSSLGRDWDVERLDVRLVRGDGHITTDVTDWRRVG